MFHSKQDNVIYKELPISTLVKVSLWKLLDSGETTVLKLPQKVAQLSVQPQVLSSYICIEAKDVSTLLHLLLLFTNCLKCYLMAAVKS